MGSFNQRRLKSVDSKEKVMDNLDQIAANAFEGYVVRKDLVRQFKGQYPVPPTS